jgi:hypothetical protein
MRDAKRRLNKKASGTHGGAARLRRNVARRARRGLRLNVPPTIIHADRRRHLRDQWQRTIAQEVEAAWR